MEKCRRIARKVDSSEPGSARELPYKLDAMSPLGRISGSVEFPDCNGLSAHEMFLEFDRTKTFKFVTR